MRYDRESGSLPETNYSWLIPGRKFKKRYPEEQYNDPGFEFIQ